MITDDTERREHRIFVTRNTEYHLSGHRCVGVRDRRTGVWSENHQALGNRVIGAVEFYPTGGMASRYDLPRLGDAMCFGDGAGLLTSPVISIRRPSAHTVASYPVAMAYALGGRQRSGPRPPRTFAGE